MSGFLESCNLLKSYLGVFLNYNHIHTCFSFVGLFSMVNKHLWDLKQKEVLHSAQHACNHNLHTDSHNIFWSIKSVLYVNSCWRWLETRRSGQGGFIVRLLFNYLSQNRKSRQDFPKRLTSERSLNLSNTDNYLNIRPLHYKILCQQDIKSSKYNIIYSHRQSKIDQHWSKWMIKAVFNLWGVIGLNFLINRIKSSFFSNRPESHETDNSCDMLRQ